MAPFSQKIISHLIGRQKGVFKEGQRLLTNNNILGNANCHNNTPLLSGVISVLESFEVGPN